MTKNRMSDIRVCSHSGTKFEIIESVNSELTKTKAQLEQAMKDWSVSSIKKTEAIVGLEKKLERAMEVVRFYGDNDNYESVYEDDEMDLNRKLDREDCCFDENSKWFSYAGEKARAFLAEMEEKK